MRTTKAVRNVVEVDCSPLSKQGARSITDRIRESGELDADLLIRAYHGSAHVALDYLNWQAYCRHELAGLGGSVVAETRLDLVRKLRLHGMPLRVIAAAMEWKQGAVTELVKGEGPRATAKTKPRPMNRVALTTQFRRPIADLDRSSRRLLTLTADDRLSRNRPLLNDLYLAQMRIARDALDAAIARMEKSDGAE